MKLKKIELFILLSILTIIVFSIPALSINKDQPQWTSQFDVMASDFSWNTSDYVNFHGPLINAGSYKNFRIYINDEDPAYNWSKTEAENDWCTGSGTWNHPYVIENLYIKGNGSGGIVFVRWSKKHFVIRNCWFDYSGSGEYDVGVCIQHAGNGTVEDNIFTYTHTGVTIEHLSENHTINNNIMISDHVTAGFGRAIHIDAGCHNNIISNTKIRNYYNAIYISRSNNLTVKCNYAENNIWGKDYSSYPMSFHEINASKFIYNVLAGDFAKDHFLINEVGCIGNIIENNTVIRGDPWVFGPLELSGTFSSNIFSPRLQQNSGTGVELNYCNNNIVAHNYMLKPELQDGVINSYHVIVLIGIISLSTGTLIFIRYKKELK